MNLLMLILIFLGLVVAGSIFYIAWEFSSEEAWQQKKKEPDDAKESEPSPGS